MRPAVSQWGMLKDALREAIDGLPGFRVSHALFTTYAFEPEFFETAVLPLLLPDGGEGLSLHAGLRRLQMEALLRDAPIDCDVYFDTRVVVPGNPLLPFAMLPVRLGDEFHAKIILLRLQDAAGRVRCLLGAGSANLTQAGWWENIEAWYFAPPFDPARPPAGLLPGLQRLFAFLAGRSRQGPATAELRALFEAADAADPQVGEAAFGVFTPDEPHFFDWLAGQRALRGWGGDGEARLEVVSPYFAERGHAELVRELLAAAGAAGVDLWLPEDPWQAGGTAALIEAERYAALAEVAGLRWCSFADSGLAASRKKEGVPRFLHAKLIRQPGRYCFMGSVNFSNKACKSNFEAGFLFADGGAAWLQPATLPPTRFLLPAQQACHAGIDEGAPELGALFDWRTRQLAIKLLRDADRQAWSDCRVSLVDLPGTGFVLPARLSLSADEPLYRLLQTCPWLRLRFEHGAETLAWVQQDGLEYRPPPADLRPDAWRILEMWRALGDGARGSRPGDFEPLEVMLRGHADDGEAMPYAEPEQDLFAAMAAVHGCFYLLRRRLKVERERGSTARCDYYLAAPRPDSLLNLLERIEAPPEGRSIDAVAAWVMLLWVEQICTDHSDLATAQALRARTRAQLDARLTQPPLTGLDPQWLAWAERMFLCEPGGESRVARQFTSGEAGR